MYRTSERTSLSRKMAELEDRWRKSQEDRYMLELKFKEVLRSLSDNNEGAKLLRIREKYHRFLENEDRRNQRNDQILRALDKIESQANILAAKTERLRLLKLHYEAYMKRVYPSWKISEDEERYQSSKKKDSSYSSRKQRKEVISPKSNRREGNFSRKLIYDSPSFANKPTYKSNNVTENRKPSSVIPSIEDSPENPSRQYRGDNSGPMDLNRAISNIHINSTRNNGNSQDFSAEQEENTSKDLLNLSLSEENPINYGTIPVETGTTDEKSLIKSNLSSPGNDRVIELEDSDRFRLKVSPETQIGGRESNGSLSGKGLVLDKEIASSEKDKDSYLIEKHDVEKSDKVSLEKKSPGARLLEENYEEVTPSVVVTHPTPDVGLSSTEEDFDRQDSKIVYGQRSPSQHEISDAEVSEGGHLGGETSLRKEKIENSPDEEQSSKDLLGNIEGPYQFSSSDADYDELENQMAAIIERRGDDENIPKVSDDVDGEPKPDIEGQDEEQQNEFGTLEKVVSEFSPEERKDEVLEEQAVDEKRLEKHVEFSDIQENAEESADGNQEDIIIDREEENDNLLRTKDRKVKSYDSERDYEAGSSSMDVNSEILDEDHNVNSNDGMYQGEESIKEVNESINSNSIVEENYPTHSEGQEAEKIEEYQLQNEGYNLGESNPVVEEKDMYKYEDVAERKYDDSDPVGEEQFNSEYTKERHGDEEKSFIQDDHENEANTDYLSERDGAENERYAGENIANNDARIVTEDMNVSKNLEEDKEGDIDQVYGQEDVQEQHNYGVSDPRDEEIHHEEDIASNYENTKIEREDEYVREYSKNEEGYQEYEKQELENRDQYEAEEQQNYQGQETDEIESQNPEVYQHEEQTDGGYAEDENVYERRDDEVWKNEGENLEEVGEHTQRGEEVGNIGPEQEEYDRYETEEQVIERPVLPESEEPVDPANYDSADVREEERYMEKVEEHEQYEEEVAQQVYEGNDEYNKHETLSREDNQTPHQEEYNEEVKVEHEQYEEVIQQVHERNDDDVKHEIVTEESNQYLNQEDYNEEPQIQPDLEEKGHGINVEQSAVEEVAEEDRGHMKDEYLHQEREYGIEEENKEINEEQKEIDKIYEKDAQKSQELVNEVQVNEAEETHTLSPENVDSRQEVVTPESNISDNLETESPSPQDLIPEEIKPVKEVEEVPHVPVGKTAVGVKGAHAAVKEGRKASSSDKHERTSKDSSSSNSRPSSRQMVKKEYDPHKVEKLKSTIRKFQLKKDNKPDRTGRKGTDSKK